jgi:hypothetical protein
MQKNGKLNFSLGLNIWFVLNELRDAKTSTVGRFQTQLLNLFMSYTYVLYNDQRIRMVKYDLCLHFSPFRRKTHYYNFLNGRHKKDGHVSLKDPMNRQTPQCVSNCTQKTKSRRAIVTSTKSITWQARAMLLLILFLSQQFTGAIKDAF